MTRAKPLSRDERKKAIIAAARPILMAQGGEFTTWQIAESASVSEGTLFRIFPTKTDLMQAVVENILDPAEISDRLSGVDPHQSLPETVHMIIEIIFDDSQTLSAAFAFFHSSSMDSDGLRDLIHARWAATQAAMQNLLAPHADELTTTPALAAEWLQTVAAASAHPMNKHTDMSRPEFVTSLTLTGIKKKES